VAPKPKAKPPSASRVEMLHLVLPQDTNPLGNVLGGYVMHLMDQAAATAGVRHARRPVVTASVDKLDFHAPIRMGQFIILQASVNAAFHSSMEIGVRVQGEHPFTGVRTHTSSGYFTFVALDEAGKPTTVPRLAPVTAEDQRRFREAQARRAARLSERAGTEGRARRRKSAKR